MNDAIDTILAEKVKACLSIKRLPNSFADNLIASHKRRVRNFRLKVCGIICILTIALGWAIIPSKHIKDMPINNKEAQIISASESKPSQEITGLMILGLLRDCIFPRRNNKKREESSNDN